MLALDQFIATLFLENIDFFFSQKLIIIFY